MKVLFVIDGLDEGGGSERSLIELVARLAGEGVESTVACLKVLPDPYGARQLGDLEVRLLPPSWPARLRALSRLVADQRPDLVHTSLFASDIAGRLAAVRGRVPVLTSLVNTTYDSVRLDDPRVGRLALRAVQTVDGFTARRLTTHFHAVSHAVKASAVSTLGIPPARISVIERGRDPRRLGEPGPERRGRSRRELGLTDKDEVLVSVGRQTFQKGHVYLLNALAALAPKRPRLVLLLAGARGDTTADLVDLTARLGLDGRVRYLGLRTDVADVLAAADLFVHPSLYEGFPGALLEAMALGLPVVASDIAPIREAVIADHTALLVPAKSPSALAAAILSLLDDPDRAAELGALGRRVFLDRYTIERSTARMVTLLRRVAAGSDLRSNRLPPV
jgi:glycosyltransferase involved in cell wall biosynthesis